MTALRCPMCPEVLEGEGVALTHSLRDHLSDVHGMADLCMDPERLRSSPPAVLEGYVGVTCPVCAASIAAADDRLLSEGLRAHFGNVHGIRSSSLLERLRR
ncbi:hypothetical protein [Methanomassiliicoccus luminyensis]|uniref:hypothetical protein n=1 Tax=Methanomassiliicoccus luminyensis TaxID=1080712 RepID=UPI0006741CF2|nr:hypothetical protein [Methanomassiliicoccus luminyensis]